MEVRAVTKYVRMSPSKSRDLTRAIQGQSVAVALSVAQTSQRKAAKLIYKTLRSAIANAEANAGLSADNLHVKSAVIEEGPRLKRYWPRARGSVSPIQRRMSHIRIVLSDEKPGKRS
ncbi:MAG: 50S ribosomal protein L22 [Spartobacteria bacterium]|nr:50S ribosomal protein L22 [Spartobacteria bacterium]